MVGELRSVWFPYYFPCVVFALQVRALFVASPLGLWRSRARFFRVSAIFANLAIGVVQGRRDDVSRSPTRNLQEPIPARDFQQRVLCMQGKQDVRQFWDVLLQ